MLREKSPFKFNEAKAMEILLYISIHVPNYYKTLKILYFADKLHLEKYGRFICGETYKAMESGPCPTGTYSIIQEKAEEQAFNTWSNIDFKIEHSYIIKPLREPDLGELSKSDIECLDEAIKNNKNLTGHQMKKKSHDEAYDSVGLNEEIPIFNIAKTLSDSDVLLKHLYTHPIG